jgi:hypothetical protein
MNKLHLVGMIVLTILINGALLAGAVWVVVKVLQSTGVL